MEILNGTSLKSVMGKKTHMEQIIASLSEIQVKIRWGEGRFWLQCPFSVSMVLRYWCLHDAEAELITEKMQLRQQHLTFSHLPVFTHIAKIFTEMHLSWFLTFAHKSQCSNWEMETYFPNNLQCNKHLTYLTAELWASLCPTHNAQHMAAQKKTTNTCGSKIFFSLIH